MKPPVLLETAVVTAPTILEAAATMEAPILFQAVVTPPASAETPGSMPALPAEEHISDTRSAKSRSSTIDFQPATKSRASTLEPVESPVVLKTEDPANDEPAVATVEEPAVAKVEEPAVATVEEPAVAKVEEPAVAKVEEPLPPPVLKTVVAMIQTQDHAPPLSPLRGDWMSTNDNPPPTPIASVSSRLVDNLLAAVRATVDAKNN